MEQRTPPIRLVQVGMGGWGQDWAKLIMRAASNVDLVGCVDIEPRSLSAIQERLAIPATRCFTSLAAALESTDAAAVLITTALSGHVPVALAALAAGKHVLVEKPFAPSLAEAQAVVAAAATAGRVLMVSQNYRFYPAAQTAAELVRNQALGPVSAVNVQFRRYSNTFPRHGHRHYAIRQPLLLDMAIHHFDLMRFVLDQEPTRVTCHAWNPPWSNFTDPAAAVATINFAGGAVVSYQGNWASTALQTTWAGEWSIECADGVIAWTGRDDTTTDADVVTLRPRGKRARRIALPTFTDWDRAGSLAAFTSAIHTGQEPPSSGRENLGSLALTLSAIEAATTAEPQRIPVYTFRFKS